MVCCLPIVFGFLSISRAREHNRIADKLAELYPTQFPTDEDLFQQARIITTGACEPASGYYWVADFLIPVGNRILMHFANE